LPNTLDLLNARNVMREVMKSREPPVTVVLLVLPLLLGHLVWTLVIHAQLDLLLNTLDLLNVKSAMQEVTNSTEPLVTIVPLVLPLLQELQA